MAILYKTDGSVVEVAPKGKKFTLEELQSYVGGYLQLVPHYPNTYCNEEGLLLDLLINRKASQQFKQMLVGDVIYLEKGEE